MNKIKKAAAVVVASGAFLMAGVGTASAAGNCYWNYSKVFGFQQFCYDYGCQNARPGQPC